MKINIECTEVNVVDRGVLEVECLECNEIFKALPSAYVSESYNCPKCKTNIDIRIVATSKQAKVENSMEEYINPIIGLPTDEYDPTFEELEKKESCFDCHDCGIEPKKKEFSCLSEWDKKIATYSDEVSPHLTKTVVDDYVCERFKKKGSMLD